MYCWKSRTKGFKLVRPVHLSFGFPFIHEKKADIWTFVLYIHYTFHLKGNVYLLDLSVCLRPRTQICIQEMLNSWNTVAYFYFDVILNTSKGCSVQCHLKVYSYSKSADISYMGRCWWPGFIISILRKKFLLQKKPRIKCLIIDRWECEGGLARSSCLSPS